MLLHVESSLSSELLFLACNLTFVLSVKYFSFLKKKPNNNKKNPSSKLIPQTKFAYVADIIWHVKGLAKNMAVVLFVLRFKFHKSFLSMQLSTQEKAL